MAVPVITVPVIPPVSQGSAINFTPSLTAGTGVTWTFENLPTGASGNSSTGQITGTLSTAGHYKTKITATNADGTHFVYAAVIVYTSLVSVSSASTFPFYLSGTDVLYRLTEDITVPGTAFGVTGTRPGLDLNGKTLMFDNSRDQTVANGNFESGTTNWDLSLAPGATVQQGSYITGQIAEGGNSLRVPVPAGATHYVRTVDTYTLTAGRQYCVNFYMKKSTTVNVRPSFVGTSLLKSSINVNKTGTVGEWIFTPTATETGVFELRFVNTSGSTQTIYIDRVKLDESKKHGIAFPNSPYTPTLTGTTGSGLAVINGTITQGAGANYDCAAIFDRDADNLLLHKVVIDTNSEGTTGDYGQPIHMNYMGHYDLLHCIFYNRRRWVKNREDHNGASVYSAHAGGARLIHDCDFIESPQSGIYSSTGAGANQPFIAEYNRFYLTSKYTNGFCITVRDEESVNIAGNRLNYNTFDYSSNPSVYGSRGIHIDRARNYEIDFCTMKLTEQANNQEYLGVVGGGCYGIQIELTSSGGGITIGAGNYIEIFGPIQGGCIRLKSKTLAAPITIDGPTLVVDVSDQTFVCGAIRATKTDFSNYTITNLDITTNSALVFLDDGGQNSGTLLIEDSDIEYVNDGLGHRAWEMGYNANGIVELRNPTYANEATKTWLKRPGHNQGGGTQTLSALVTHDCELTFVDNLVAQSGLSIGIDWFGQTEVFSGTTNAQGKVTPRLTEWEADLSGVNLHTPHFITTSHPSYHSLELTEITRETTFDVIDDNVGTGGATSGISFGSSANAANGTSSLTVPYATPVSEDNLFLIAIANKLNGVPAADGWNNYRVLGGYGSSGVDTGSCRSTGLYKEADGTETGSVVVSVPSANSSHGRMLRYTKDPAATWSIDRSAGGVNSSVGTAWSVVGDTNPGIQVGDVIVAVSAINTDNYTYSNHSISCPGISSWGTPVVRHAQGTTTGNDVYLVVTEHTVLAGTSSGVPTYTMTASGSNADGPAGGTVMFRLRTTSDLTAPVITSHPNPATSVEVVENTQLVTTFTVTGNPAPVATLSGTDAALFQIVGNSLRWITPPDYDALGDNTYEVTVTYTNSQGSDLTALTVTVLNENEAPTDITLSNDEIGSETDTTGGYTVGTLTTLGDPDAGDTATYTVVGGDDASLFTIGGAGDDELVLDDGVVSFFRKPTYNVVVRTTDAGNPEDPEEEPHFFDKEFDITIAEVDVIEFAPLTLTLSFGDFEIEGGTPAETDNAIHLTMDSPWDSPVWDPSTVVESAGGDYQEIDEDEALTTARWGRPSLDVIDSESTHHGTLVELDSLLAWQDPGLLFDDVDGYVTIPDFAHSRSTFSASAWIKTTTAIGTQVIVGHGGTDTTLSWLLLVASGKLQGRLSENGTDIELQYTGTTTISDGEWHHVAMTWDSGSLKLYVDGVQEAVQIDIDEQITSIRESVSPIVIGAMLSGSTISLNFTGTIQKVALYNETLSGASVEQIAEDEDDYVTNRLAHYKMDYSPSRGTVTLPEESVVMLGELYGPNLSMEGTLPADLPDDPLFSILTFRARDEEGEPVADVSVSVKVVKAPTGTGTIFNNATLTKTTDEDGYARFTVPKGADVKYWVNEQWKNLNNVGLTDDIVYVDNWIGHA